MLAQSFLSAADLGITEPQLSALQKTLVLLETGKLVHDHDFNHDADEAFHPSFSAKFNMRWWATGSRSCGTIACIGGTAELVGNIVFPFSKPDGLYNLFHPRSLSMARWIDITPAQAATALRSYLTSGDAKWHEAVSAKAARDTAPHSTVSD